jgi:hypothetical protein
VESTTQARQYNAYEQRVSESPNLTRHYRFRPLWGSGSLVPRARAQVTDSSDARARRRIYVCKYGTITNTLAAACELRGEVEAVAPVTENAILLPASP